MPAALVGLVGLVESAVPAVPVEIVGLVEPAEFVAPERSRQN